MAEKREMERYLPFVRKVALRLKGSSQVPVDIDELVSWGVIGLSAALDHFHPEAGVPFESFAFYRVRGAMLEGIARQCPVGRHVWRRIRLQQKAADYMEGLAADVASNRERTAATDASLVATAVRDICGIYSVARLATRRGPDGAEIEFIDEHAHREHEERVVSSEMAAMLERLPQEQSRLMKLYYLEDLTLDEVGERMGFKKSWACKLHKSALKRLREMMEDGHPGGDPALIGSR